jgi:hypothetical protein
MNFIVGFPTTRGRAVAKQYVFLDENTDELPDWLQDDYLDNHTTGIIVSKKFGVIPTTHNTNKYDAFTYGKFASVKSPEEIVFDDLDYIENPRYK